MYMPNYSQRENYDFNVSVRHHGKVQIQFMVHLGSSVREDFGASNGVSCQGRVLFHHLFNVYMNGLSEMLKRANIGCMINDVRFNHLMYAHYTVLFSPSARGLLRLILLCEKYAMDCDVIFNVKKSNYMCIKPQMCTLTNVRSIKLNGI